MKHYKQYDQILWARLRYHRPCKAIKSSTDGNTRLSFGALSEWKAHSILMTNRVAPYKTKDLIGPPVGDAAGALRPSKCTFFLNCTWALSSDASCTGQRYCPLSVAD